MVAEGVHDPGRQTGKTAGTGLDRPLAETQRERRLQHVEHVIELAVAVRRQTGEPRRERVSVRKNNPSVCSPVP